MEDNKILIELIQSCIEDNSPEIDAYALENCHCIGLYSFMLCYEPRIRFFYASKNCEIAESDKKPFNWINPIIPIHRHKYDDKFITVFGQLNHHMYFTNSEEFHLLSKSFLLDEEEENCPCVELNEYKFPRISDDSHIELQGRKKLYYIGSYPNKGIVSFNGSMLHTVSVESETAWLVLEINENKGYNNPKIEGGYSANGFHANLLPRKELYKKVPQGTKLLKKIIKRMS